MGPRRSGRAASCTSTTSTYSAHFDGKEYPITGNANADMIILNTCHIREKATEKVYSELGQIKLMKAARAEAGGAMTIAVAGCVAQAEGEDEPEARD